jgi:hypothetical protein
MEWRAMNPTDYLRPEFLTQQLTAFGGAWLVMLPTIVGAWWLGWWLRGTRSAGKEAGLEGRISVLNERLTLAADQTVKSDRALEELKKEFQAYKANVAAEGSNASPAKMDAAIIKVADSNTTIGSSLFELYRNLDFGQHGALKKLDYETTKKPESLGKPFINIDPTKKR